MNFFLISGPQSSGKTSLIHSLFSHYNTHGYTVAYVNRYRGEIQAILGKDQRQILLQSDTDLPGCIMALKKFHAAYPAVDTIITACRKHPDPMRTRLFHELKVSAHGNFYLELPVGRMPNGATRTASVGWYLTAMEEIALIAAATPPFSL